MLSSVPTTISQVRKFMQVVAEKWGFLYTPFTREGVYPFI
jgi:hypothetical protein